MQEESGGALISWRLEREGQFKTQNESNRMRGIRLLEITEGVTTRDLRWALRPKGFGFGEPGSVPNAFSADLTSLHVPLQFFRNVIFHSIDDLLHRPEVLSGGRANLRSKGGHFLVDSIARCASSTEELASHHVELGKTASLRE